MASGRKWIGMEGNGGDGKGLEGSGLARRNRLERAGLVGFTACH